MSLHLTVSGEVPASTATIARAAGACDLAPVRREPAERPRGCAGRLIRPGWSAMTDGQVIATFRKARRSGAPMPRRSARWLSGACCHHGSWRTGLALPGEH